MRTTLRRLVIALFGLAFLVIAVGPWVLYEWALSNVRGRPSLPAMTISTPTETEMVWRQLKEQGPVQVEVMTPHRYIIGLGKYGLPAGSRVAWIVARDYNQNNLEDRRMIWWHFSGAALTIWLTRHWSTEQLLSKAKEINQGRIRNPTEPTTDSMSGSPR